MARLEDWTIHAYPDKEGNVQKFLTGRVYNHPDADAANHKLVDGNFVRTSNIVHFDSEGNIVTTSSGTVYELGGKSL